VRSKWDENIALKQTLNLNEKQTIYVEYGDMIGRSAWFVAVLIMFFALAKFLRTFGKVTPYGGRNAEKN
jgi:hypothetical protein